MTSWTSYTALMHRAYQALESDPAAADRMLAGVEAIELPPHAVLPRAWATLVRAHLAWSRGHVQRGQVGPLLEAASVFSVNDLFDQCVRAQALAAHLAAAQGDAAASLRTSFRAFRDVRASPDARLLAARPILWMVPSGEEPAAAPLLAEIRGLVASAPPSSGQAVALAYLAFRDFRRILHSAGIPTDAEPYPPAATLSLAEARRAVRQMLAPLEDQMHRLRAMLPAEPVPMLFVAAMQGFVHGSASCISLAREVERACGSAVDPYVNAAIGVAHLRNGEPVQALEHLQRCVQAFAESDRVEEGRPWAYYLSMALRANHRWREAIEVMDRFLASAPRTGEPWRRSAMVMEAFDDDAGHLNVDRPRESTALLASSRPPYVRAALKWMNTHLHERVRVPQIATAAGVSRRTLEVAFRTYRNRSLSEELRWMRMHRALELLQRHEARLAEVRTQVGYASASAFSRDFRRVFGVLPSRAALLVDYEAPP